MSTEIKAIYLNDWKDGGFIDMVADFEGIYLNKREYESEEPPYANAKLWFEKKSEMKAALDSQKWTGVEILLASYSYEDCSGDAFVLFRRDGKLWRVDGGHCSCYGLEGQWEPQETNIDLLLHEMDNGKLGSSEWNENHFSKELRLVIDKLQAVN